MKSSVALLNSLCGTRKIPCQYTLVSRKAQVHLPTFTYRCKVGEFYEEASDQSKKKAKQKVAKKVLIKVITYGQLEIDGRQKLLRNLQEESKQIETSVHLKSLSNSEENFGCESKKETKNLNPDNPVGKLQEICAKKYWNAPVYYFEQEFQTSHDFKFKYFCNIENLNIIEYGQGKSKKTAKRESAVIMLNRLQAEKLHHVDAIPYRVPIKLSRKEQQKDSSHLIANLIIVSNFSNEKQRSKRIYFLKIVNETKNKFS